MGTALLDTVARRLEIVCDDRRSTHSLKGIEFLSRAALNMVILQHFELYIFCVLYILVHHHLVCQTTYCYICDFLINFWKSFVV